MSRENISHVVTLTHSKSGITHSLKGDIISSPLVSVLFKATANFESGNMLVINGTDYTVLKEDGSTVSERLFQTGSVVHVSLDVMSLTATFKTPGGKGGVVYPEGTYALAKAFRQNGTWIAPCDGKFRFICVGRGGAGSLCQYNASKTAVTGAGGGSGAWCEKIVECKKDDQYTIQITSTSTNLVKDGTTIMSAGKGAAGSGGFNGIVGVGGDGGIATGGDINHDGIKGGDGTTAANNTNGPGGNGAPVSDWTQLKLYLSGIYGVGGYNSGNTSADGLTASESSLFGQTLACGGGGGGLSADRSTAGKGGAGGLGAVLVEFVLGPVKSSSSSDNGWNTGTTS